MRANSRALPWAAGLVLLVAALVATTSDGPEWTDVSGGSGVSSSSDRSTDGLSTQSDSGDASPADPPVADESTSSSATRWIAVVVLLVAVAALAVGVTVGLRLMLRRRTLEGTMLPRSSPETEDEPEVDSSDELVDEVSRVLWSAAGGSPRNAIVATWIRLHEAMVAAGFEPREAETPTEFVQRTLTTYPVDEQAISRLADLYREARFSAHDLTEEHRREAVGCLRQLHRQLAWSGAR